MRRWVRAAIASLDGTAPRYAITLRFVDADEARALNREFRGRDYATNVLTFAYSHDDANDDTRLDTQGDTTVGEDDADRDAVEADLVVCLPVVEREACEQRKDVVDHCAHLVVHGTLHAAGLDHDTPAEAEAMEAVERRVLKRFGIADPYG